MDHDDTVTEDSTHTQQELEEMMESLVTRMIKSEMEDFELVLKIFHLLLFGDCWCEGENEWLAMSPSPYLWFKSSMQPLTTTLSGPKHCSISNRTKFIPLQKIALANCQWNNEFHKERDHFHCNIFSRVILMLKSSPNCTGSIHSGMCTDSCCLLQDKSADYSLTNSVGVKNNIFSILVLGIYESLMEYTFHSGEFR